MKKTNEELLEFFGLKIGDKIKVDGRCFPFVIKTGSAGFIYADEVLTSCTCNIWFLPGLVSLLSQSNYEIIAPKKKTIGELTCDEEIICAKCPLKTINCSYNNDTLYEQLDDYKKSILSFGDLRPFEQVFIDAIKAELDKDVEE